MKRFVLRANVEVVFTEDDLWPERDGPEEPTEHHVRAMILDCGGIVRVLRDWNLQQEVDWDVVERG